MIYFIDIIIMIVVEFDEMLMIGTNKILTLTVTQTPTPRELLVNLSYGVNDGTIVIYSPRAVEWCIVCYDRTSISRRGTILQWRRVCLVYRSFPQYRFAYHRVIFSGPTKRPTCFHNWCLVAIVHLMHSVTQFNIRNGNI